MATRTTISPAQRATIRLGAWNALDGWGTAKLDEKGDKPFRPYSFEERMKYAAILADWAMGDKP